MMKEAEAKAFFMKYVDRILAVDSFIHDHTECVVRTAKFLANLEGLNVEEAAAAAWLHDVGYCEGAENHADKSLKICLDAKLDLTESQLDAIQNHGNGKNPKTKMGKMMQKADKLSLLDERLLKKFYPQDAEVIRDYWIPSVIKVLQTK